MYKLKPFQKAGIDFCVSQRRAIVIAPVGSGKTDIALGVMKRLKLPLYFVFCPKSLVGQWKDRTKEFNNVSVVAFSQIKNELPLILAFSPQLVIVDEAKSLKSPTQVFQLLLKIKPRRRLILDATPIENDLEELWFLFRWLKPKLFGVTLKDFMRKYGGRGRYRNLNELRALIAPHIYNPEVPNIRKREIFYFKIKPRFDHETQSEHFLLCRKLRNSLIAARDKKTLRALNVSRGNISKLRSFFSSPECGGMQKIDLLIDYIKNHKNCRGVIFCYRKDTAKMIAERINDVYSKNAGGSFKNIFQARVFTGEVSSKQREILRKGFNEKTLRFLVATSAGERGLDLPSGNLIVHFDLPWTRASYNQRDRVSRLSSDPKIPTRILTFILAGTIEEIFWSIIAAKYKISLLPYGGGKDCEIIRKKTWLAFLNEFLGGKIENNTEKEKGIWFIHGKKRK